MRKCGQCQNDNSKFECSNCYIFICILCNFFECDICGNVACIDCTTICDECVLPICLHCAQNHKKCLIVQLKKKIKVN